MPINIVTKANSRYVPTSEDLHYKYPNGLDLKPGSKQHDLIRDEILTRAQESYDVVSRRHPSWNLIDELMTSFIPLSEDERTTKAKDSRKPVSTVVPLSYAVMETLLTYMVAVYLDEPIFRYDGIDDADVVGAAVLEQLVGLQTRRFKAPLSLHTMFRDFFCYGLGVTTPRWVRKMGYKTRNGFRNEKLLFEGNMLDNIDPYNYLPDPNHSAHMVEDFEFCGWLLPTSYPALLREEALNDSIFNVGYLKSLADGRSYVYGADKSARDKDGLSARDNAMSSTRPMDAINMYVDLIPAEWQLGPSEQPEKWKFVLVADSVVIQAMPLDLDHDMFPVAVCCPDFDGYSPMPMATLEVTYGLQEAANFLYNSHMMNVRKALNDMFIVDPEMINLNDMLNPEAGLLIRLRKSAWGRGVQNAVEQFKVQDVTRSNIGDMREISEMLDRATGSTNALSGMYMAHGERRSATEIRETRGSALSRLEKKARIAGIQAIQPLAYMYATHTQQFMSADQVIRISGWLEDELRKEFGEHVSAKVGPMDIDVDFDIVPYDGALPTSGDPELWLRFLQAVGANPELAMSLDSVKLFKHFAKLSGAKNINDFVKRGGGINTQVLPDEQVAREAERGNLVPLGG